MWSSSFFFLWSHIGIRLLCHSVALDVFSVIHMNIQLPKHMQYFWNSYAFSSLQIEGNNSYTYKRTLQKRHIYIHTTRQESSITRHNVNKFPPVMTK